jgi:hypothetical protein
VSLYQDGEHDNAKNLDGEHDTANPLIQPNSSLSQDPVIDFVPEIIFVGF